MMNIKDVNIRQVKYILFDVDGVLVDSESVFNKCWLEAASLLGYNLTFNQALNLRSCNADCAKFLFKQWFDDESSYSQIRQKRKELMTEYINTHPLSAKEGFNEVCDSINRLHLNMAIVTASPMDRCKEYLQSVGINLNLRIISGDMVRRGKPDPDIYKLACLQLGCLPHECIAVEDAPNGLKSAHQAGCYTVMIPDLSPYNEDLCDIVNVCCSDLKELSQWLLSKYTHLSSISRISSESH